MEYNKQKKKYTNPPVKIIVRYANVLVDSGSRHMMLGHMMFEGKHIHYSPVDNKPLCSYSAKLCKQRRLNGYAFCIRHILEDKSSPFKQCAFVAKYNRQKCTNPIPANEDREYCNSHMQVLGMAPKKERKGKKEKESPTNDGKLRFADRLRALLKTDASQTNATEDTGLQDDPYAFPDSETENVQSANTGNTETVKKLFPELTAKLESTRTNPEVTKTTTTIVITSPSHLSTVAAAVKATSFKTSKTMNRLQAKIAQNKILDKLRKTQESSQPAVVIPVTTSSPLASPSEQSLEPTQTELLAASPQELLGFPPVPTLSFPSPFPTDFPQYSYPQPPSSSSSSQYAGLSTLSTTTATTTTTTTLTLLPSVSRPQLSPVTIAPYITHNIPVIHIQPKQHKLNKKLKLLSRIKNIPPTVHKFLTMQQERRLEHTDLFPLGLELSDSEGSENFDEDETPWQQHWLSPSSGEDSNDDDDEDDTNSSHPWLSSSRARELQLSQVRTQLKGQLLQLTRTNRTHKLLQRSRSKLIQCIMQAARTHSSLCVDALVNFSCRRSSKEMTKPKGDFLGLEQKQCCYTNDKEPCSSSALPYTRHCIKHIMYNVDQLLFEHCTAKFADNTQCCVPVFDICHELPLCPEHARKRDNYNKLAAEPKPKKPRKKTKPSALTRPPKRGKKKKRATYVRPQKPRSPLEFKTATTTTSTTINTTLPGVEKEEISSLNLGIDTSQLSPATNNISADDLTKDFDGNLDNDLDHELDSDLEDDLLPGHIDKSLELPLDAADLANPTRLLEDHELNEVLNKLPDDAFQDLFTGKNGEFIPSKEETEELERALAAVSKDVKSVKESLEKLSALSEDDLSNSMDIHNNILNSDHTVLPDLSHASVDLNAIARSMVASDLSSISQALSTNTDSLTLSQVQGQLSPGLLTSHILQVQVPGTAAYSLAPHILAADALISPQRVFTDEQAVSHALSTIMAQVPNSFTTVAITDAIASHSVNQDGLPPGLDSPLSDIRNPWTSVVTDQSLGTTTYSNGYPICLPPYTQQTLNKFTFPTLAVTLPANTTISNIVTNTSPIPRTVVPTFTVTTTTSQADS